MAIGSVLMILGGIITGEWMPPILVISSYAITILVLFLVIWNKFANLKAKGKSIENEAIAKEYFKLKELHQEEITDPEILELKELEKRYNDRDFV